MQNVQKYSGRRAREDERIDRLFEAFDAAGRFTSENNERDEEQGKCQSQLARSMPASGKCFEIKTFQIEFFFIENAIRNF